VSLPIFAVLAEGRFGPVGSKTAASAIRYLPERVAAVLDSEHAGERAADVLGFGASVPVVATLEEALARAPRPEALLIGVAPQGGILPEAWRGILLKAIDAGLDVWSGLHQFLGDDPELAERAGERGVGIVDLRRPPPALPVSGGLAASVDALRVLTVGTDCNVGKMTAGLELRRELVRRGVSTAFAPTGQTGILLEGWGVAVDAVVADFVAGSAESLVLAAAGAPGARTPVPGGWRDEPPPAAGADVVLVEGQGSLLHPGYSGVTLGLLHGTMPQAMILLWMPSRPTIYSGRYDWVEIPPLERVVGLYEEAAGWIRPPEPSRVVAVSATTYDLSEAEARRSIQEARERTGLPVTDPVRFGPGPLADAVQASLEERAAAAGSEGGAPVGR
jgi:uncharacterized NAD-dependent epimerase/dehydratase family protein